MDAGRITAELNAALAAQQEITGDDGALAGALAAVSTALEPALRAAAFALAEEAAAEVSAQLSDQRVAVVLAAGMPQLVVQAETEPPALRVDELEARITLRLPQQLKTDVEAAATAAGVSVNGYVVQALTVEARRAQRRAGRTFRGTIRT